MKPITDTRAARRRGPSRRHFDVIVVIPARNEEERIEACLRSVLTACEKAKRKARRVGVVVVADGCTDSTTEIARSVLSSRPFSSVVECDIGNVALVRALGVSVGRTIPGTIGPERTWLANTDADTTVPPDWLLQHLDAARRKLQAIAGVVDVQSFDGLPAIAQQHFIQTYTALLPNQGDHSHVHAANLGVRLDAYDDVGGWGCLPRSEDRDLWTRLQQRGARIESPTYLRVVTSGRAIGRVPGGFAECLRQQVLAWELRDPSNEARSPT